MKERLGCSTVVAGSSGHRNSLRVYFGKKEPEDLTCGKNCGGVIATNVSVTVPVTHPSYPYPDTRSRLNIKQNISRQVMITIQRNTDRNA